MKSYHPHTISNESGSILIISLWCLILLGGLAAAGSAYLDGSFQLATRYRDSFATTIDHRSMIHSIISQSLLYSSPENTSGLQADTNKAAWHHQAIEYPSFEGDEKANSSQGSNQIQVTIMDQESLLPLNTAPSEVIARLLTSQGILERDAQRAADSIVDWRDPDATPLPHGQEHYTSYQCKNSPLDSPSELSLINGVTDEILPILHKYCTVFSNGSININVVRPEVLSGLNWPDPAVEALMVKRDGGLVFFDGTDLRAHIYNNLSLNQESRKAIVVSMRSLLFSVHTTAIEVIVDSGNSRTTCTFNRRGDILRWTRKQ